jgi:flavin-dependent dehydrogenase
MYGQGAIGCFITDPQSARLLGVALCRNWNDQFRATQLFGQLQEEAFAERVHATSAGLSALQRKHGERWIVVGDAAARLDPLGSSGTMTALHSAQRAARAIMDSLKGNPVGVESYERWSSGLVEEFTRQRRQHYSIEHQLRPRKFWDRRVADTLQRV